MTTMLPAKLASTRNLKDVFQSAEASVLNQANALGLPSASTAIVVMVDGLGFENLVGQSGFLSRNLKVEDFALCGFPSTTVASIASFASASEASEHGLFAYSIFNRSNNEGVNLLSGLDRFSILDYLKKEPISAQSRVKVHSVTLEQYQDSGFTRATMHKAEHHFATDIETRFEIARKIAANETNALIYLYVPELDREAHLSGVYSEAWAALLDTLSRATQKLVATVGSDVGILLTADHGVLNISAESHIYLDLCHELEGKFLSVCGDPRAPFIYLDSKDDLELARSALDKFFDARALALTPDELIQAGYWLPTLLEDDDLVPDLVAISIDEVAIFHRDFAKPNSLKMIGHHGSISSTEMKVPLIGFGAYSSSLLVP